MSGYNKAEFIHSSSQVNLIFLVHFTIWKAAKELYKKKITKAKIDHML